MGWPFSRPGTRSPGASSTGSSGWSGREAVAGQAEEPMRRDDERTWSTRVLLGEIGRQLVRLAEEEVDLARAELASDARAAGRSVIAPRVGVAGGVVGVTLLLVAAVLALTLVLPGWLAALIVAVAVLAGG